MFIRSGVNIRAYLGEPAFIPGQADDIKAVRKLIVGGTLPGQRGLDAVAVEIPGVWRFTSGSGTNSVLPELTSGECTVSGLASELVTDEAGPKYGYEYLFRRIKGARKKPGQAPTPAVLGPQTLLVTVEIERAGEKVFWPRWCGLAADCRKITSPEGADAFVITGIEYADWLSSGVLDPRWLSEGARAFEATSPNVRIREMLRRINFLENRPGGASGWDPTSAISTHVWSGFAPRRTRQGLAEGHDDALGVNDADGDPLLLEALTVQPGSTLGVRDQLAKIALYSEGRLISHQGIGPIRDDRLKPDKEAVPQGYGYPSAEVQIDWGGVLAGQKNVVDDQGLYEFGGFETPITLTMLDRKQRAGERWLGRYKVARVEIGSDGQANVAAWSGLNSDGSPRPAVTFVMDSAGAGESLRWIRKDGVKEHVALGQAYVHQEDNELANAAAYAKGAAKAARLLQSVSASRPVWHLELVNAIDTVDQAEVAAALQSGHEFKLQTDRGTYLMLALNAKNDAAPGRWTIDLACTPVATVFDPETSMMLPNPPRAKNLLRVRVPGDKVGSVNPYEPVTDTAGSNPPRPLDQSFLFPWTDYEDLHPGPPPDPLETGYDRHGPRCVVTPAKQAIVYWSWPEDIGDMPIRGWLVEAAIIDSPGRDNHVTNRIAHSPVKQYAAVTVDPWQCHHVFAADDALTEGRAVVGQVSAVTGGHPLTGYSPWRGTTRFYSRPALPPGSDFVMALVRRPESNLVSVIWEPPTTSGGDEIAYYSIERSLSSPVSAGPHLRRLPAGTNAVYNALSAPDAELVWVIAHNATGGAIPFGEHGDDRAGYWVTERETVRGTDAVPDFSGTTVKMVRHTPQTAGERVMMFWEEPKLPAGTGQVDGAQLEITEGGSTRTVDLTRTQYLLGVYTSSYAGAGEMSFRIRGKTGSAFGPWSRNAGLGAARAPGPPRPVAPAPAVADASDPGTTPDFGLFRTSDGTRQSSDGYGFVFEAPLDPGGIPSDRSDVATVTATGAAVAVVPDDHTYTPSGAKGYYDLGAAGNLGWGDRALIAEASSPGQVAITAKTRARGVVSEPVTATIPAVGPPGEIEDLLVFRESPTSDYVRLVFHMPRTRSAGQPAQIGYRIQSPGTHPWRTVKINPDDLANKMHIPRLDVGQGAAVIAVRARTEGGTWGPVVTYSVPSAADSRGETTAGAASFGAPRDLDVHYMDARQADPSVAYPNSGQVPQVWPTASLVDDYLMIISWREPPRSSTGGEPGSYLVSVTAGYNDRPGASNRAALHSAGLSAAQIAAFQSANRGLLAHAETGSRNLWIALPVKDLGRTGFVEHPEIPSVGGRWIRVSVVAQDRIGLRPDGSALHAQYSVNQKLAYFRGPRRPAVLR